MVYEQGGRMNWSFLIKLFLPKFCDIGDDPRDVKARLKVWAQAVAIASTSKYGTWVTTPKFLVNSYPLPLFGDSDNIHNILRTLCIGSFIFSVWLIVKFCCTSRIFCHKFPQEQECWFSCWSPLFSDDGHHFSSVQCSDVCDFVNIKWKSHDKVVWMADEIIQ